MKTTNVLLALTLLTLSLFSCKKDDDVKPLPATDAKSHYMPLTTGNSWTYSSDAQGEYTANITGTEKINGFDYFVCSTTTSSATSKSHMAYEGNKLYVNSKANNQNIRLLILDEDAKAGDKWKAGEIKMSEPNLYSSTTTYTCEYVAHHDTYKVKDKTYSDVIEVNMTTSLSFVFSSVITAGMSADDIKELEEMYSENMDAASIKQRTFYAKGVGFIYQYSNDMPKLGAELLSSTIK